MVQTICTKCKSNIKIEGNYGDFQILKCSCSEYPAYKGIVYLLDDQTKYKSLNFIRSNNKFYALKSLIKLPYRLFIPFYFILNSGLGNILGFHMTLQIVKLFGYDIGWTKYLLNRENIPYYKISLASLKFINKKRPIVLDIGCGTGHFLGQIKKTLKQSDIVAIDISFLNLYLAKYFFANLKAMYICCNAEGELPFDKNIFDYVHMSDTFQYIKNKSKLLKSISKTIKFTGILAIPHTHQKSTGNIIGITKDKVKHYLNKSYFKSIMIANDNSVLINLGFANIPLISNADAFSLIASKSHLPIPSLFSDKNFIILSPHLDDAVLSSSHLIKKLKDANLNIKVITLFTKGGKGPHSPQAKYFLNSTGFNNPIDLFNIFIKEDRKAMNTIGIKYKHFGFIDAAFRKDSSNKFIYKNASSQFSGTISNKDKNLIKEVSKAIKKEIININNLVFIAPLGIGGHADHIITRKALDVFRKPIIFWGDYPYNLRQDFVQNFFSKNKNFTHLFTLKGDDNIFKEKLIRIYKSQLKMLFPNDKISGLDETYYVT